MNTIIRPESTDDYDGIRQVNQAAFGQDGEADLVDALRDGGFVRLSLVAEYQESVIGHILFSALQIVSDGDCIDALALAPMSVLPEHQRQGIGSLLVQTGLDRCKDAGHRVVIVVGHPGFYPKFGFSADLAAPLQSKYAGEAFMALELVPGAMDGLVGDVRYPGPFSPF